jgi:dolichyl-diphosphooligosaccharide--protein glycosyltransferase
MATFLLTQEVWNTKAGLVAAVFMSISPGYTQRSVAGSFDNEGVAIFILQISFYGWIKASKSGSIPWSVFTAFCYFYMASAWGGYVFILNMIALHSFFLLLTGQYSERKVYHFHQRSANWKF